MHSATAPPTGKAILFIYLFILLLKMLRKPVLRFLLIIYSDTFLLVGALKFLIQGLLFQVLMVFRVKKSHYYHSVCFNNQLKTLHKFSQH